MDSKTTKVLLAAGGAAAAAALAYYLLRGNAKEAKAKAAVDADGRRRGAAPASSADKITKEQVLEILQEIIKSQEQMKGYMKDITKEFQAKSLTFDQTYQRVKEVQPVDPLEKHGLSMVAFDQLLDEHQGDPQVRESIAKIMGAPNPSSCTSEKVQSITVKSIIDVHTFMLEELDSLVKDFLGRPNKESYDMKAVTIAAQAIVGSRIEGKFGITSEDIESAVLIYHTMLATNQDFAAVNIKIQHTMGKLVGTPFSAT